MEETQLLDLCLNPQDIARIAEFFECDIDAAYEFARRIWLPDARITAERMISAISKRDWTSLLFLCDHLREGARNVGASRIMVYASEIESLLRACRYDRLSNEARNVYSALETLGSLLSDCGAI